MIKLTLFTNKTPSEFYAFDQAIVYIGGESGSADITLADEKLLAIHLSIEEINGRFIAVNIANDPFISINNLPFGKRVLHDGDTLQIGEKTFHFEGTPSEKPSKPTPLQQSAPPSVSSTPQLIVLTEGRQLEELLENKVEVQREALRDALLVQEDKLEEEEGKGSFSYAEMEDLFRQVEELEGGEDESSSGEEYIQEPHLEEDVVQEALIEEEADALQQEAPAEETIIQDPFLEEDLVQEALVEEDIVQEDIKDLPATFNLGSGAEDNVDQVPLVDTGAAASKLSRWLIVLFLLFLFILGIFFAKKFYADLVAQAKIEELHAAEGASDIAMALLYAKIHKVQPQNHNWSDVNFLRNNLASILPAASHDTSSWAVAHDSEDSPYSLRIYTSVNLSRFLVIVQPKASIHQWLVDRPAIAVDSEEMLLRKTLQFKELNRLLLDPDLFAKEKEALIGGLLHQFDLIPLDLLAKTMQERSQYQPPKALAMLRPGAENKIYNAPRYYLFGETLVEKASGLFSTVGLAGPEQPSFTSIEVEALTPPPDMVFYSSLGMRQARRNQEILQRLSPADDVLTAYLRFNSDDKLVGSHLLIGDRGQKQSSPDVDLTAIAMHIEKPRAQSEKPKKYEAILQQLKSLILEEQKALAQQAAALTEALSEYINRDVEWDKELTDKKHAFVEGLFANWSASVVFYKQEILLTFYDYFTGDFHGNLEEFIAAAELAGFGAWARHAAAVAWQVDQLAAAAYLEPS